MSNLTGLFDHNARGRASEIIVAGQLHACGLPVFRPDGAPAPLHDLIVEVERGRSVSIHVRTLSLRDDRPTFAGSVALPPDNLASDVFAFVGLELGVTFIVPRDEIPVRRRVSWQPPALRKNRRMRGAFDLDPYLMAFDKLWAGVEHGPRHARRRPGLSALAHRSHWLLFGKSPSGGSWR
jgi:hypothetical protein